LGADYNGIGSDQHANQHANSRAMISIELIQVFGIVTGIFCAFAVYKCRKLTYIPLHWLFFVAMMLGAFGISALYFEIGREAWTMAQLIPITRLLWFFVLLSTSLMAISVLIYRE